MAKQRLFPEPPSRPATDASSDPREQFNRLATKIFSVPKSDIDEREKKWRTHRKRSKALT